MQAVCYCGGWLPNLVIIIDIHYIKVEMKSYAPCDSWQGCISIFSEDIIANTKVSAVQCTDYLKVKDAIKEAMDLIGGLESINVSEVAGTVKTQCTCHKQPEAAVNTILQLFLQWPAC